MSLILMNRENPEITILTLNRPEKRNALSIALMEELIAKIKETQFNPSQRVLILQGNGPFFCLGLDLSEVVNPKATERSAELLSELLLLLYNLPLVTIAAVHGAALAGGAGLMSVCDLAIAAEDTYFGFPELKRGLVPALIMTFLRRQVSERHLRELFLFGNNITAEKGLAIGLVNHLVPSADLLLKALIFAKTALQGAPIAQIDTKYLFGHLYPTSIQEDLSKSTSYHLKARISDEAKEGATAFLEKRAPQWFLKH